MSRFDPLSITPSPAADPSPASHPSYPRLAVGHHIRHGYQPGIIIAIHGEQRPETCASIHGVIRSGGNATFDVAFEDHIARGLSETLLRGGLPWTVHTDRPLATPSEILTATTAALEAEAADKRAADENAAARAAERAALPAKFPWLRPVAGSGKSGHAMGAANLKAHLQHDFPGHKFSVKSESYSGGCSIKVSWYLGPTEEQVSAIAHLYVQGRFDGMTDCYDYNPTAHCQVFGGAKHVSCSRRVCDDEDTAAVLAAIGEQVAAQGPTCHGRHGHTWDKWARLSAARSLILHTAYPPGAQITGARLLTPAEREAEPSNEYPQRAFKVLFTAPASASPTGTAPRPWERERMAGGQVRDSGQKQTDAGEVGQGQPATCNLQPATDATGIELSFCSERNHVRLKFPSKPGEEIRTRLKKAGFRWYGPAGVWYHKRTPQSEAAAREFLATTPKAEGQMLKTETTEAVTPEGSGSSALSLQPSAFRRKHFLRRQNSQRVNESASQ